MPRSRTVPLSLALLAALAAAPGALALGASAEHPATAPDDEPDPAWAPADDAEDLATRERTARLVLATDNGTHRLDVASTLAPEDRTAVQNATLHAEPGTGNATADEALADAAGGTALEPLLDAEADLDADAEVDG
jgi:hypothetical protein